MSMSTLLEARFPAAGVGRLGTAGAGPVSEVSDGGKRLASGNEADTHSISFKIR